MISPILGCLLVPVVALIMWRVSVVNKRDEVAHHECEATAEEMLDWSDCIGHPDCDGTHGC